MAAIFRIGLYDWLLFLFSHYFWFLQYCISWLVGIVCIHVVILKDHKCDVPVSIAYISFFNGLIINQGAFHVVNPIFLWRGFQKRLAYLAGDCSLWCAGIQYGQGGSGRKCQKEYHLNIQFMFCGSMPKTPLEKSLA